MSDPIRVEPIDLLKSPFAIPYPTIRELLEGRRESPDDWLAFKRNGELTNLDHICGWSAESERHLILVRLAGDEIVVEELEWRCERKWEPQVLLETIITKPVDHIIERIKALRTSANEPIHPNVADLIERLAQLADPNT